MRVTAILTLLLAAPALHAQAPKTFAEGVLAFEKGEWKKAEQLMRETIAVNPNESAGTVSISGSWFETYVPHYFLARALAKQKKCEEALRAFAETERQGVSPTIADFARHLRTRGGCRPQAAPAKPDKVLEEVTVPFGEDDAAPAPAPVPSVVVEPVKPAIKPAGPKPAAPQIDVRARTRLTAAITAYVSGRYEETLRILTETKFDGGATAAEAALFRAAARDALYRIGGEKDGALRAQVVSDLRTYRALRPKGKPDPRIFSPRFVAMAE